MGFGFGGLFDDDVGDRAAVFHVRVVEQVPPAEGKADERAVNERRAARANDRAERFLTHQRAALQRLERMRDDLRVIRDQTERVGEVARRLLALARDEPDVREAFDLNELIGRVVHFLEPTLGRKALRIDLDLASDLPTIHASQNGLEIVVLNLMLNAVDASHEGGAIGVLTRADGPDVRVRLQVSDQGIGIKEEHLERIFEPFFTTKEGPRGTGLGLAVTRSVVQSHGGEVTVTSALRAGSCFTVTLPPQPS